MPMSEKALNFRKEINRNPLKEGKDEYFDTKNRQLSYDEHAGRLGIEISPDKKAEKMEDVEKEEYEI